MNRDITETVTRTVAFSDVSGHELGNAGWAIVRREDGKEVAHFNILTDLRDSGQVLYEAAWEAVKNEDEL